MSFENAQVFLKKIAADQELENKTRKLDFPGVVNVAAELGLEMTEDELKRALTDLRKETGVENKDLTPEELDKVAGGALWCGEDAPDGHEMGCLSIYHRQSYQMENEFYCKENYYCASGVNSAS